MEDDSSPKKPLYLLHPEVDTQPPYKQTNKQTSPILPFLSFFPSNAVISFQNPSPSIVSLIITFHTRVRFRKRDEKILKCGKVQVKVPNLPFQKTLCLLHETIPICKSHKEQRLSRQFFFVSISKRLFAIIYIINILPHGKDFFFGKLIQQGTLGMFLN